MSQQTTPTAQPKNAHHLEQIRRSFFHYKSYQHQPRNINEVHSREQKEGGINTAIAVALTKGVGSMWTAYSFAFLALIGLLAILNLLSPMVALLIAWASQTLIQLVLLPVIMVGQNVLGRKQELLANEQYETTKKTYSDIEQIMKHLAVQDEERLQQTHMLLHLLQANGISTDQFFPVQIDQQNGHDTTPPPSPVSV